MKDLIELITIVTNEKLNKVSTIVGLEEKTKVRELYELIRKGEISEEEELAAHLYNKADKRNSAYKKLRNTLKEKLTHSLFLIDLNKTSYQYRQKAYYECCKDWAAAKILFGKKANRAALDASFKVLKIARKYEFTALVVDVSHNLRLYFGTILGDFRKYEQYNKLFKEYEEIWQVENKIEEQYIEITAKFVNKKAAKLEMEEQAVMAYQVVHPFLKKYDTYLLHLCGRLIELAQFTTNNNYSAALDVCDRAIDFFDKKAYTSTIPYQAFYYQKLICLHQLQQLDKANDTIAICRAYFEEGNYNWFKFNAIIFLIQMHQANYELAITLCEKVFAHPQFSQQPIHIKENWEINQAYLNILGILKPKHQKSGQFKIDDFLARIKLFSQDKKGINIPIILLDMIYSICSKEEHKISFIDRAESIDKYRRRYLQEANLLRCNIFMKMLLLWPNNAYQLKEVKRKVAPLLQKLLALSIQDAQQLHTLEIIPFEILWVMLLEYGENMN